MTIFQLNVPTRVRKEFQIEIDALCGGNILPYAALTSKPEINTGGGICCVESSRASKMTSRDLGVLNSECTIWKFKL